MYRDRSRPSAVTNNFGGVGGYMPSSFNSNNKAPSGSRNSSDNSGGYVPSSFNSNNSDDSSTPSAYKSGSDYNSSSNDRYHPSGNISDNDGYTPDNYANNGNNSGGDGESSMNSNVENDDSAEHDTKSNHTSPTQHGIKGHQREDYTDANTGKENVNGFVNRSPVPLSSSSSSSHYNALNKSNLSNDASLDRSNGSHIPSSSGNYNVAASNASSSSSAKPMDEENIDVVIRVRPLRSHEKDKGETPCVKIRDRVGTAGGAPISQEVQVSLGPLEAQVFSCKKCFNSNTSQEDVFIQSGITSLLDSSVEGYRACAFAFGQTGAGKTYTVIGPSNSISPGSESDGLLGRSIGYMYDKVEATRSPFTITISCLEIYAEHVYDLLVDERDRMSLPVRENPSEGFFLEGSKAIECATRKAAFKVIDSAMKNRHIGEHDMNSRSSRSHCLTEINISIPTTRDTSESVDDMNDYDDDIAKKRNYVVLGRMSLVDLAGSERLKSTKSTGKVLQEAGFINKSLYVLGKVIAGLVRTHGDRNHRDVPYRDSKLTKLLISSLGGAGRTMLMACISEASGSQVETLRTLKFSMSAARIKNKPVRFLSSHDKLVENLRDEIRRLRNENMQLRTSLSTAPSMMGRRVVDDDDVAPDYGDRHNLHHHRLAQGSGINRVYSLQDTRVALDHYGQRMGGGLRHSKSMKVLGNNRGVRRLVSNKMDVMMENNDEDADRDIYAQDTSNLYENINTDDDEEDERIMKAGRRAEYDDRGGAYNDEYNVTSMPQPRLFGAHDKDIYKPILRKKPKNSKKVNKFGGSPVKFKKAHPFLSQQKREEARMLEKISPNKYQPSAMPSHQSAESEKIRLLEERLAKIERESNVIHERRAKEPPRKMTRRKPAPASHSKDIYSEDGKVSPFLSHIATHGRQLVQKNVKSNHRGKSYMLPKIMGEVDDEPIEVLDPKEKARRRAEQIRKDRQRGQPVQGQNTKRGKQNEVGVKRTPVGVERTSVRPQRPGEIYEIKKKARARALANSGHYNHNHNFVDDSESEYVEVEHADVHRQVEVLESQLREQRRQMEDNPGAVTTEDEERAVALEKEVRAMKVETAYLKDNSSKQKPNISSTERDIHSSSASSKGRLLGTRENKKQDVNKKTSFEGKENASSSNPKNKPAVSKTSPSPEKATVKIISSDDEYSRGEIDDAQSDGIPTPRGVKDAEKALDPRQPSSSGSTPSSSRNVSPPKQSLKPQESFKKGDRVEGNYNGEGEWYPGTVVNLHEDGEGYSYDINYDDGDKESKVQERLVRKLAPSTSVNGHGNSNDASLIASASNPASVPMPVSTTVPPVASSLKQKTDDEAAEEPPTLATSSAEFQKGDRIEAQFDGHKGGADHFPGVVSAVRGVDSFDIDYDDGDKETNVKARYIRKPSSVSASPVVIPAQVEAGAPSSPHKGKHHHNEAGESDDEYGDDDFDDDFEDE